MYFCSVRLKLDRHLILQMGLNYVYRFLYCEKAFQKFDRDLFCSDVINLDKFDRDAERFQFLCQDFNDFIFRQNKVLRCVTEDFVRYSSFAGDTILHKETYAIGQKLLKANYMSKVRDSRLFVNKILNRLLKERAKRKSAEDPTNSSLFLSDTPSIRDTFPDPGFPSVHPVSIEKQSSSPVSIENVSAEGKSKDKPSAPERKKTESAANEDSGPSASAPRGGASVRKESAAIAVMPPEVEDGHQLRRLPDSTTATALDSKEGRRRLPDGATALDSQSSTQSNPPSGQSDLPQAASPSPSPLDGLRFFKSLTFPFKSLTFPFPTIIPAGLLSMLPLGLISILKVGSLSKRGLFFLPILLPLVAGTTFRDSISNVFTENVERLMVGDRPILLTFIAALALTYALNYRKNSTTAKVLSQVMITFLSIYYLLDISRICSEVSLDEPTPMLEVGPAAGSDDPKGPSTQPDADTSWHYSKKVLGCILLAGLAVAAGVYYLKGFAPVSPDDMATFRTVVSQGVENVASEQVSLNQTLSDQVNSAAFRAEMLNRTSEGMLSDIAAAGDAARQRLEQMTGVTQDFIHLHSRADGINDRMTTMLRGIVYLISLKWAFSRGSTPALTEDFTPVAGSDVVNEVMSLDRPFSFPVTQANQTVATSLSTQNAEAVAAPVGQTQTEAAATVEISTQTDETDLDRIILSIVNPAVAQHGVANVLSKLRRLMATISNTIISNMLSSSDDDDGNGVGGDDGVGDDDGVGPAPAPTPAETPTQLTPVRDIPTLSPVAVTDSSDRLESIETVRSSDLSTLQSVSVSEITPRRLDEDESFRVADNPTFRTTPLSDSGTSNPSLASPIDEYERNPYQLHRHELRSVKRLLLHFCETLERLGLM